MARLSLYTFNRGEVDRKGLARLDVKRLQVAAEEQSNWMPRVLGPMSLRPGLKYTGTTRTNHRARALRFIFSTDDTARIELTDSIMRVWVDDELIERPEVTAAVTNGSFTSNLTGWTDMDSGSAVSSWLTGGFMQLVGAGASRAIREQQVTVNEPGIEHALRITIRRGPVMLRIGSTSGDDDYQQETALGKGTHSIAFTPSGNFFIRFFSSETRVVLVEDCDIEAAGVLELDTPWELSDFNNIRYDQSADVLFLACKSLQQRKIERRGTGRSWSVVLYQPSDGPFKVENTGPITIQPSDISGNISLTASEALFRQGHVGALFALTSVGQLVTVSISAQNTFSDSIRVTGLRAQRGINFSISGTFVATVKAQRSFDNVTWANAGSPLVWTAPDEYPYNDGLDNQIVYYRIGVNTGDYTSGTAVCSISIDQGSIRGVVRVTSYGDPTSVGAEVLDDLGGTDASAIWEEGQWSEASGWPMAVAIHEGRMWWAGLNGIWGSISDAYESFDPTFEGDAGTINRTIGSGPVDTINWILSLKGMLMGAQGVEYSVRSSSLDEPLTPTNFNVKPSSTQGSGSVDAFRIDQSGYFVDRTGCKLYEMSFDVKAYDYGAMPMMELCPEIGLPGIVRMDVQRKPDTRIHLVRSDGIVLIGVINRAEDVLSWHKFETDGEVEDVVVLPALDGDLDDQVYYLVARLGGTVRYWEKWAQEIDCRGGATNLQADSHLTFTGPAQTFLVPHLASQEVVVWGNSVDLGTADDYTQTYTADETGLVRLDVMASNVCIGLGYEARFKSTKLGFLMQGDSPLNQTKKIDHVGFITADTHKKGIRFGPDFDHLDDMPLMERGASVTEEVSTDYDEEPIPFPGKFTTNARVCLVAQAPRPATVLALTVDM